MNRKRWLAAMLGLSLVAPLRAADAPNNADPGGKTKSSDTDDPRMGAENERANRQIATLAKEFGVPAAEVARLRSLDLGWGEIRHILAVARKAGVPADDVLKLRREGLGWGEIARKFDLRLGAAAGKGPEAAREPAPRGAPPVRFAGGGGHRR